MKDAVPDYLDIIQSKDIVRVVGSLIGAVHLSINNGGVPRSAQCRNKSHIEEKRIYGSQRDC